MVLYHAITSYHVLNCILHKLKYNLDKEAVLYISSSHFDSTEITKKIKKSKIFSDVKIYKEFSYETLSIIKGIKYCASEIEKNVKENQINIKEIEEINMCGDHYALGLYLSYNNVEYSFFEEAAGILSRPEILENNVEKINKNHFYLLKNIQVQGKNNECIKNRYGELSAQIEGYKNEKDIDFSVTNILSEIDKTNIEKIIEIFDGEVINKESKKVALILTQHFINLNVMSYNEQKLLYTLLSDYFCENHKLVIKPHPSDIHGLYEEWFPDAVVLSRKLPSEIIPYCSNSKNFDIGVTANSTAIYGMSKYIKETICFSKKIETQYVSINRYYIVLLMLKKMLNNNVKIYEMGTNIDILQELAKVLEIKLPNIINLDSINYPLKIKNEKRIILIDDLSELSSKPRKEYMEFQENLSDDDTIIYINTNNKEIFCNEKQLEILNNIIPVVITKKPLYEEIDSRILEEEIVYVYSKVAEAKEVVKNMKETKELYNTGIKIEVNSEDNAEIKMLKGMLKATETRLLELSKSNERLRKMGKENEKMKNSLSWKITKPLRFVKKKMKK